MFPEDLGRYKASGVARNLVPHMIAGGAITAINLPFEKSTAAVEVLADVLLVLVDNNRCRLHGCQWARQRGIPVVFAMLSLDGMRMNAFLQGQNSTDACLWCALPNLDPEGIAPCAAATMSSCLLASAAGVVLAHRALMPWPDDARRFNWHEADMLARTPSRYGEVARRTTCPICAV